MEFQYSSRAQELRECVTACMDEHVYPVERRFHEEVEQNTRRGARWTPTRLIEELKPKARAAGLWNLFPDSPHGAGLTNLEYAPLAELMGRVPWASEVFNCSAPDTGNMETIERWAAVPSEKREGIPDPGPASRPYLVQLALSFRRHGAPSGGEISREEGEKFKRFIEVQLLWDKAMAEGIAKIRQQAHTPTVVALMGSGHMMHGNGTPLQLRHMQMDKYVIVVP